jgi:hypothetical protein
MRRGMWMEGDEGEESNLISGGGDTRLYAHHLKCLGRGGRDRRWFPRLKMTA